MKAVVLLTVWALSACAAVPPQDPPLESWAQGAALSADDRAYLDALGPVRLVVDPDWAPYESLDPSGRHTGIAADLVDLIARQSGVHLTLLPTRDWEDSLAATRDGRALVVSFLNQTPQRDGWLVFTEPYFVDPNVFITRQEHDFIGDPARLTGETIVFPAGTSLEERMRTAYPDLRYRVVESETEALALVSRRQADLTLRSLTMAAYTIRKDGWFNLKIAGSLPEFDNRFRMGVVRGQERLRDLLNRGVAALTPQDVQQALNRHIVIQAVRAVDYSLVYPVGGVLLLVVVLAGLWILHLRRLNAEKALILREVHHRMKNNMSTINGLLVLQSARLGDSPAASVLDEAQHRIHGMMALYDQLYQAPDHKTVSAAVFLPPLVRQVVSSFALGHLIRVETEISDLTLSAEAAQHLGILVNEVVTNAMKYAFPGGRPGTIRVSLNLTGGQAQLTVADDGVGLSEPGLLRNSPGFGATLITSMARSLKGTLRVEGPPGTRVSLTFPRS